MLMYVNVPGRDSFRHLAHQHNTINSQLCNPRLPPYPHPTTVYALLQIRQAGTLLGGGATGVGGASCGKAGQQGMSNTDNICVAACFAKSRAWAIGSPNMGRDKLGEGVES